MSIWTKRPRIDKREFQNLLLLCFFDQGSFDETFEDIWKYADDMNMHTKQTIINFFVLSFKF